MICKGVGLLVILATVSIMPAFAQAGLEKMSIIDSRLEDASKTAITDKINVNQPIQISADIVNHQTKSQDFSYIVQIKNNEDTVVALKWISAQLTPNQKFSPSLSWTPSSSGEYVAEIFLWENLKDSVALTRHSKISISVV